MFTQTLILNQAYRPHDIVNWKDAVTRMFKGTIEVLVQYDEILAHIDRQTLGTFPELRRALRQVIGTDAESLEIKVPAVAVLRRKVSAVKGGVKFSKINVCLRDDFRCQYCLAPEHQALTADLRWAPLGDLRVGDVLVGFEEQRVSVGGRRFLPSVIESHEMVKAPLYRVLLEDGTVFSVTAEHNWLARAKRAASLQWYATTSLQGKYVPRLFDCWSFEDTREAGWLAGIFDGEGWTTQRGMTLAAGQNPGPVLERLKRSLQSRGFEYSTERVNALSQCVRVNVLGTARAKVRLLGQVRPHRLLHDFDIRMLGRVQTDEFVRVVEVAPAGKGWVAKVKTSTGTLVADGFPHHNCGQKLPMSKLNYDHVIPRSRGGKTTWENIVMACYPCNDKKGNQTVAGAGMHLLSVPVKPKLLPMNEPPIDMSQAPDEWIPFIQNGIAA